MGSTISRTAAAFTTLAGFIRTAEQQRVALAVYRILAGGEPATPQRIAEEAGVPRATVASDLARWPATFRDGNGAVTGFFGLSSGPHNHRFEVEGQGNVWTWCTYDSLFITEILGVATRVVSECPVSGATIELTLTPTGIDTVEPAGAVMSMIDPELASADDIITSLCQYIRLFVSSDAAETWVAEHPGTFVISIADAFEVARRMNAELFATVLAGTAAG